VIPNLENIFLQCKMIKKAQQNDHMTNTVNKYCWFNLKNK